jgi:hypothetical protein
MSAQLGSGTHALSRTQRQSSAMGSFVAAQCRSAIIKKKNNWVPLIVSLFGLLVADGWCWFVLREEY